MVNKIHEFEDKIAEGLLNCSDKGFNVLSSIKTPDLPEGSEVLDFDKASVGLKSVASMKSTNSVAIAFDRLDDGQYWINQLKAFNGLEDLTVEEDSFLVNPSKKPLWGIKWLKTATNKAILFLTRLF